MTAGRTIHACNSKDKNLIMELYLAFVRTIENETARKATGAGDLI